MPEAPRAPKTEDQDEADSLWQKLLAALGIGDDEDEQSQDEDRSKEDDSQQDEPDSSAPATGPTGAEVLPAAVNHTTMTAEGLADSIGFNTHVTYGGPWSQLDISDLVTQMGAARVRDGSLGDSPALSELSEMSRAGVKIDWIMPEPDQSFTVEQTIELIKKYDAHAKEHPERITVEGPNEHDLGSGADWAANLRAQQEEIYRQVNQELPGVKVLAPSFIMADSRAQLGQVPADVANMHSYTNGAMPSAQHLHSELELAGHITAEVDTRSPQQAGAGERISLKAAASPSGVPVFVTETGYHTATASTSGGGVQNYVSEDAQATLMVQQALENYRNGIDASYFYALLDDGDDEDEAEDKFGVIRADGTWKPAGTALKNMLATLRGFSAPTGPIAGAAVLKGLDVQVQGGGEHTQHLVLPRSDGNVLIALWEAAPVWDQDAKKALEVPSRDVTLQLGVGADAQVVVPRQSARATDTQKGTSSVSVTSQADPTFVVLHPSSSASSEERATEDSGQAEQGGQSDEQREDRIPVVTSTGAPKPGSTPTRTTDPTVDDTGDHDAGDDAKDGGR
ncbi:hypothetical protein [Kineococcus sp. SYSU DK005]|uniref:hypothetical protein n=1 Tax=Kineococcus sp. SYSU DK005 TaxID=3383126 RepID=UPI003D7D568D